MQLTARILNVFYKDSSFSVGFTEQISDSRVHVTKRFAAKPIDPSKQTKPWLQSAAPVVVITWTACLPACLRLKAHVRLTTKAH